MTLIQDRAHHLPAFSIGEFGQPPARRFDDADEHVVALLIGQLPLQPSEDSPFLSKALIPFANRRKTASIPRRTVDDPETSGFEQDLPGSPPPWKSRHLRLCSEEKMKRIVLQVSLGIAGLLMLFRFGGPALFWGATGPGPFGNRWLTEGGTATLLLDADLRFFGAMMIGVGFVFFWTILKVEEEVLGALIYILACTVAIGAASRIYARITYGNPGTAGTIPIAIEGVIPILLIVLRYYVGKDIKRH